MGANSIVKRAAVRRARARGRTLENIYRSSSRVAPARSESGLPLGRPSAPDDESRCAHDRHPGRTAADRSRYPAGPRRASLEGADRGQRGCGARGHRSRPGRCAPLRARPQVPACARARKRPAYPAAPSGHRGGHRQRGPRTGPVRHGRGPAHPRRTGQLPGPHPAVGGPAARDRDPARQRGRGGLPRRARVPRPAPDPRRAQRAGALPQAARTSAGQPCPARGPGRHRPHLRGADAAGLRRGSPAGTRRAAVRNRDGPGVHGRLPGDARQRRAAAAGRGPRPVRQPRGTLRHAGRGSSRPQRSRTRRPRTRAPVRARPLRRLPAGAQRRGHRPLPVERRAPGGHRRGPGRAVLPQRGGRAGEPPAAPGKGPCAGRHGAGAVGGHRGALARDRQPRPSRGGVCAAAGRPLRARRGDLAAAVPGRAPARRRQDRDSRRDPQQARRAHRAGGGDHALPRRGRAAAVRRARFADPEGRRDRRRRAPRALGRPGLSARLPGRADPHLRPHHRAGGRVRRPLAQALLQGSVVRAADAAIPGRRARAPLRSRSRGPVHAEPRGLPGDPRSLWRRAAAIRPRALPAAAPRLRACRAPPRAGDARAAAPRPAG
jgi:hypothetical protein